VVNLEFDPAKEKSNREKHGVDFSTVEVAFADPWSMTLPNETHSSKNEKRFYLIGFDGVGILTVRFTLRNQSIRVIGAGYWRKHRKLYEENKATNL
jgi:hypothetical protein